MKIRRTPGEQSRHAYDCRPETLPDIRRSYPTRTVRNAARLRAGLGLLAVLLMPCWLLAQPMVNINYGNLNFVEANKVHKKGVLGQTVGSRTLYTSVATVNGVVVDCIITTMSITNGRFEYPTGFCPGTIPFDFKEVQNCPNPDTPAVTLRSNEDRYFCPTFFFETGGGSCRFKFEFIAGGSYNDATDKGSPLILRNVYVNSYDIDGNADCSSPNPASNQYNDFSGFNSAARATPGSRIAASYNSASGMTRFMSISNCNITDIKDPTTRIRVEYQYLQEFEVEVGMTGRGRAFFMFDFGPGPAFTPMMLYAPVLDLNTLGSGDGYNNVTTLCSTPERLSKGSANITSLNNSVEQLIIAVPGSDIRDGNAEILATDISTLTQKITLGTPFSGSQSLTVTGTTYTVNKSVTASGMRQMVFTKNGGNMTNSETEKLLDSLVYFNSVNSAGLRRFTIWLKEGVVTSTLAFFEVYGGCIVLSASTPALAARVEKDRVWLGWRLGDPLRTRMTSIERATADRTDWKQIHARATTPEDAPGQAVEFLDMPGLSGTLRYRLVETDNLGARRISAEKVVRLSLAGRPGFFPNPVSDGRLHLWMDREGPVSVYNEGGQKVFQARVPAGMQQIYLGLLRPGSYTLVTERGGSTLVVR
jgi:hypothetical protein